jgi:hypothetical protein
MWNVGEKAVSEVDEGANEIGITTVSPPLFAG